MQNELYAYFNFATFLLFIYFDFQETYPEIFFYNAFVIDSQKDYSQRTERKG